MTTEQISKLEAGEQLDAMVAGCVMGWSPTAENGNGYWMIGNNELKHFNECRFSTDISAAWQVVEKMKSLGYSFGTWDCTSLSSVPHPGAAFAMSVYAPTMQDARGGLISCGRTIPLCICRAALMAIERTNP